MATVLRTYTQPQRSEYACVDGYKITYSTAGPRNAPAVLLIHGWSSHRGIWQQTVNALKDRYYCVSVDLMGFGGSDKPHNADYSIPEQARRVLAIADALGLDRFALVGHSMGGQVSLYIAANLAPERVTKLISVAGVVSARLQPYVEHIVYRMVWIGHKLPFLYEISQRFLIHLKPYAYLQFRSWFYRMNNPSFAAWRQDREMAFQPGIHTSMYRAGQAIHGCDLRPHLGKIFAPTRAIFGKYDGTVPPTDGELVAERVPGADLVLLDDCGHFPMYEQPTAFMAALTDFLDQN